MSVLSNRDANLKLSSKPTAADKNVAGGEEHTMEKQAQPKMPFAPKLSGHSKSGSYVSPSDAIVSPASKKLADFKQRQINKLSTKNPSARTLFARSASSCSSPTGLDDCEDVGTK